MIGRFNRKDGQNTKHLTQDSGLPSPDTNRSPLEYKRSKITRHVIKFYFTPVFHSMCIFLNNPFFEQAT